MKALESKFQSHPLSMSGMPASVRYLLLLAVIALLGCAGSGANAAETAQLTADIAYWEATTPIRQSAIKAGESFAAVYTKELPAALAGDAAAGGRLVDAARAALPTYQAALSSLTSLRVHSGVSGTVVDLHPQQIKAWELRVTSLTLVVKAWDAADEGLMEEGWMLFQQASREGLDADKMRATWVQTLAERCRQSRISACDRAR